MSDSPAAARPDPTDEFLTRIQQYVRDAEIHMALAEGTISNTLHDSDFLFVVKMYAVLEPLLKEAVREHVRREFAVKSDTLIKEVGELGIDKLRKILVEFGALNEDLSNFLNALSQVRNRYAHHIVNAHLSVAEVCDKVAAEGNDGKLLEKLTGFNIPRDELTPEYMRASLFFRIAGVLERLVRMAKPPPPLPPLSGGLFGGTLFETPLPLRATSSQ
jgi:hypothetical protein